MPKRFTRFADFYPVYLAMHDNQTNRRLHLLGNVLVLAVLAATAVTRSWWLLLAAPIVGNSPPLDRPLPFPAESAGGLHLSGLWVHRQLGDDPGRPAGENTSLSLRASWAAPPTC
jgi:hypothetical protein